MEEGFKTTTELESSMVKETAINLYNNPWKETTYTVTELNLEGSEMENAKLVLTTTEQGPEELVRLEEVEGEVSPDNLEVIENIKTEGKMVISGKKTAGMMTTREM